MNNCVFIGNIGKDFEVKHINNKKVVEISLAVKDVYNKENTDWVNVTFWEKTAEILEKYCKKGSKIGVIGQMKTQVWEKEGKKHYKTYILGQQLQLLSSSGDNVKTESKNATGDKLEGFEGTIDDNNDDLPF